MNDTLEVRSAAVSDRGLSEKRPHNEDSYLEIANVGVFAVADGVGGAEAGEVASQMAVEIVGEAFANMGEGVDPESVMRAAFDQANASIYQMAQELPQLARMATTVVALHLRDNIATIGHVGDSRLYRLDREGSLILETDDHSLVADEVRAGRMTEDQALNHPSRNIINRALGAEPTVDPDLKTLMIEPGTSFLLCSDGITRHVDDQEIRGVLTFGGSPEDICDYLRDLCFQRGAEDNLTAIVVKSSFTSLKPQENHQPNALMLDPPILDIELPTEEEAAVCRNADVRSYESVLDPDMMLPSDEDQVTVEIPQIGEQTIGAAEVEPLTDNFGEQVEPAKLVDDVSDNINSKQISILTSAEESAFEESEPRSRIGWLASMLILFIFGAAVGAISYHLFYPASVVQIPGQLTEMQSADQQLSAFEENRRNIDDKPAEALVRFSADPRDAEDHFLLGRAYLLLGQYQEAKQSFTTTRTRIAAGDVDVKNIRTIETEIAIAMAVINDTTVQSILRSQLEGIRRPASSEELNKPENVNTTGSPQR